ncbi:uncharacterized protein [Asterias amurensis]|uniref:uncharacterized protein isoform X2 n=1 Tax=Asterias amurensis TaxID=7602 RepID=UPI003AB15D04
MTTVSRVTYFLAGVGCFTLSTLYRQKTRLLFVQPSTVARFSGPVKPLQRKIATQGRQCRVKCFHEVSLKQRLFPASMRMTFKRGVIAGLMTVTAFVGLYLGFFNHPPPSDTLEANAHHHGETVGKVGPPKFADFGPPPKQSDGFIRSIQSHNNTAKRTRGKALRNHPAVQAADRPILAVTAGVQHADNGGKDNPESLLGNTKKVDFDLSKQDDEKVEVKNDSTSGETSSETKDVAVVNDVNDQPNAKEDEVKSEAIKEDGNALAVKDHKIPKIDWDLWMKDNGFVDIGTLWGYCDDSDPPVIGKVLLMKDEDRGGLKIVVVMNTTFDEPVEYGSIFVSVMYGDMNFYEKDMDICTLYDDDEPDPDEERDTFFDCPMAEGNKYYIKEIHVPFFVPSGHFKAKAKLTDQAGRIVLCASADMTL